MTRSSLAHVDRQSVDRTIERILALLRSKMHEKHQTQLQVQEKLGWSRTYISQLLNRNKKLRFDQVLGILSALEIEPPRFFAEVFADRDKARLPATLSGKRAELVVASMARVLVEKGILGTGELEAAITFMEKQEKTS